MTTGGRTRPVALPPPGSHAPLALAAAAAVLAGLLAALGVAGVAMVAIPVAVGCALGLLGQVPLFLVFTIAVSGVGFHWTGGAIALGGTDINLSGLHWLLVLGTGTVLLARRRPPGLPLPLRLYGIYLAVAAIALVYTSAPGEGVKQLALYGLPWVVALVVLAHVEEVRDIRQVLGGYWVAFVIGVLAGIGLTWISAGQGGAFRGGVGDRTFAIFLLPLLALALAQTRHRSPAYVWGVAAIAVVGLATLSRTALLIMAVLPLLATLGARPGPRLAAVAISAMAVLGLFQVDAFRERFGQGGLRTTTTVTVEGEGERAALSVGGMNLSGRGWLWMQVGTHAMERPVIGHGTGSATVYTAGLPRSPAEHPHNDYLRVFHDQGVGGLALILAFGVGTLLYFRRLHREATTPLGRELALASFLATAAFGMIAFTDNPLVYSTFFTQNVFVLYALAVVVNRGDGDGHGDGDGDGDGDGHGHGHGHGHGALDVAAAHGSG